MKHQHSRHSDRPNRPLFAWGALTLLVGLSAIPMALAWRAQYTPPPAAPTTPAASAVTSASRILVDVRDEATVADIADLKRRFGLDLRFAEVDAKGKPLTSSNLLAATLSPNQSMNEMIRTLEADPLVESAEPESRFQIPEAHTQMLSKSSAISFDWGAASPTQSRAYPDLRKQKRGWKPNDELYPRQWNFEMVGAQRAWKRARGRGVIVAVLDTGVAAKSSSRGPQAHDFAKTEFVPGWDFINGDDDPYDGHGHGTHVAGTIAESTNNKTGASGLAFEASIMPIKVLSDDGYGSSEGIAEGIRWAVDNGAQVLNLSLGSPYPSKVIERAVNYARRKGAIVVCAAGNSFGGPVGFPAGFKNAVAVSSVGPTGDLAFYSSVGPEVTLAAPGGDRMVDEENGGILQNTILPPGVGEQEGDGYYQFQGTSMASPHVAAVAALLMSQGVHDPSRVRDLLVRSATAAGGREQFGAGILSADKATAQARRWGWAASIKTWVWAFLILPLVWKKPRSWWSPAAWSALGAWWLRPILGFAFWVGAFGPDWVAAYAGANSPLNMLAFSALLPAILFWQWPDQRGSRIVMALSGGTALCLLSSTWGGLLSPFTGTAMGWTIWPWAIANLFASITIGGAAWLRSQSTLK